MNAGNGQTVHVGTAVTTRRPACWSPTPTTTRSSGVAVTFAVDSGGGSRHRRRRDDQRRRHRHGGQLDPGHDRRRQHPDRDQRRPHRLAGARSRRPASSAARDDHRDQRRQQPDGHRRHRRRHGAERAGSPTSYDNAVPGVAVTFAVGLRRRLGAPAASTTTNASGIATVRQPGRSARPRAPTR